VIELTSGSPTETEAIAATLASALRAGDVVTVSGELGSGHARKTVEVEVRDLASGAVVAVTDRVRRARHALAHAERNARTAHERRLPRAELARDRDHVAGLKPRGELRRERLGLFR